jgi:hypothetical protein
VINEQTDEFLRELTLDYQPLGGRPGPDEQKPRTRRGFGTMPMSGDITMLGAAAFEPLTARV